MSDSQNTNGLNLSDSAIAHVAKVLQVALLTGTDIVDNLRLAKFEERDGTLCLTSESEQVFNTNLEKIKSGTADTTEVATHIGNVVGNKLEGIAGTSAKEATEIGKDISGTVKDALEDVDLVPVLERA